MYVAKAKQASVAHNKFVGVMLSDVIVSVHSCVLGATGGDCADEVILTSKAVCCKTNFCVLCL